MHNLRIVGPLALVAGFAWLAWQAYRAEREVRSGKRFVASIYERTMIELREYDPADVRAQWVRFGYAIAHCCPRCDCRKSSARDEPNHREEQCRNDDCMCHHDADVETLAQHARRLVRGER